MDDSRMSLVARIADTGLPLPKTELHKLSDLPEAAARHLAEIWPRIALFRRREIMRGLADICQASFEVDFCPIALLGLQDPDSMVRLAAIDTFWDSEDPALVSPLLALVENDPDPTVQASAAQALGQHVLLGELGGLADQVFDHLISTLLLITQDRSRPTLIRCRALEAVAAASLDEIPGLIREAYHSDDEALKVSAITAMGRTADEVWEPMILAELDSINPGIRYHAALAAGQLGLVEAVELLVEMLEDPDPEVIQASIWALGEIGGARARQALEDIVDDEELEDLVMDALETIDLSDGSPPTPFYDLDL